MPELNRRLWKHFNTASDCASGFVERQACLRARNQWIWTTMRAKNRVDPRRANSILLSSQFGLGSH